MGRFGCRELCYASLESVASSSSSTLDRQPTTPHRPYSQRREVDGQHMATPPSLRRRKSLTKMKGKEKATKKTRSHMTKDNKERVQEAQKRDRLKTRKTQGPSWIYVGNLHPATTPSQIKRVFRNCGRILDVSCRVTRGTTGAQSQQWHRTLEPQDRVYAAVQFADQVSPLKAHKLDGTVLNGFPIVVCYSAVDLPDAKEIVKQKEYPTPTDSAATGFFRPAIEGLWQHLTRQRTERIKLPDDPQAQPIPRNKVMGMSMPLTIV